MNPLLNEQLGQATHREYEAKYSRQYPSKDEDKAQFTYPSWQKLAFAAGSIATLIILASLVLTG
jgi:hypothetical protein